MIATVRDRLAEVLEACTSQRGFDPPRSLASWEWEAVLTWRDREPLVMSAYEMDMLKSIENLVLGHVR